ncbi:EamA family transporter [Sphingobacterium corticibacter]|uniref:EamA family transporter n=1 Tax=Sphingobacterium corticibacter TaxID=2171749 RepID=A0A2T8HET5_9SPHI|nr:EamA family transporter [Sphingobacterium corticibacter]PVH23900.1 EamA family transporter [Sphingobacterium corticibacter]
MEKLKGSLAVFFGAASFGVLSTFVKKAYKAGFTLGEVTGSQALFGVVFLWLVYAISQIGKAPKQITIRKDPKWLLFAAGLSSGLVSVLYYQCVQLVPASIAIILLMQYIWIGAILEWLLFKKAPSQIQLIGCVLIIVGTIFSTGLLEEEVPTLSAEGLLYGFGAATAYSLFIMLNGRIGNDYPTVLKSALMITGALVLILVLLRPVGLLSLETMYRLLPYGLLLALFGTVIPPLLFAYGMPKTGYSLGSILSAVELPVAVSMSHLILGEYVSGGQWFGLVFILAVIVIIQLRKPKKAPTI